MRPRTPARLPGIDVLIEAAANGHDPARTRAAGRLMTLLESEPHRLPELFRWLPQPQWPRPLVIGITGAPGSGKSTLVDVLVAELRRQQPDRPVGIIAVDPSSPFTGGAVLGDRVRMMRHATDPLVFIRSLATRGHLGGLSLGVKGVLRVLGLIGCRTVIVETVGVGQSEVEIARVADRVAVVLAPGAGDSIQMLKAGLMEVGDIFIVNKADTEGAAALHRSLLQALRLAAGAGNGDGPAALPEVILASASRGDGIPALAEHLLRAPAGAAAGNGRALDGTGDVRNDVREAVLEAARRRLELMLDAQPACLDGVLGGDLTVNDLVETLFAEQLNP
jgi:LAO/AO transport system kinase